MTGEDIIKEVLNNVSDNSKANDGVELFGDNKAEYVDYKDIKSKKRRSKTNKKDLNEWVAKDFVLYSKSLYKNRYNVDWNLNFSSSCQEILKVRDDLQEIFGFDGGNIVLKDFIDYFFTHFCDSFIQKNKQFYFQQMRKPWVIGSFTDNYNYHDRLEGKNFITKKEEKKEFKLSQDDIEDSFLLSGERLVSDFGILLSINWLYFSKGYDIKNAIDFVYSICNKLYSRGLLNNVIDATEKFNPYPNRLKFTDVNSLVKKIDNNLNVEVVFGDVENFQFLLKGEK